MTSTYDVLIFPLPSPLHTPTSQPHVLPMTISPASLQIPHLTIPQSSLSPYPNSTIVTPTPSQPIHPPQSNPISGLAPTHPSDLSHPLHPQNLSVPSVTPHVPCSAAAEIESYRSIWELMDETEGFIRSLSGHDVVPIEDPNPFGLDLSWQSRPGATHPVSTQEPVLPEPGGELSGPVEVSSSPILSNGSTVEIVGGRDGAEMTGVGALTAAGTIITPVEPASWQGGNDKDIHVVKEERPLHSRSSYHSQHLDLSHIARCDPSRPTAPQDDTSSRSPAGETASQPLDGGKVDTDVPQPRGATVSAPTELADSNQRYEFAPSSSSRSSSTAVSPAPKAEASEFSGSEDTAFQDSPPLDLASIVKTRSRKSARKSAQSSKMTSRVPSHFKKRGAQLERKTSSDTTSKTPSPPPPSSFYYPRSPSPYNPALPPLPAAVAPTPAPGPQPQAPRGNAAQARVVKPAPARKPRATKPAVAVPRVSSTQHPTTGRPSKACVFCRRRKIGCTQSDSSKDSCQHIPCEFPPDVQLPPTAAPTSPDSSGLVIRRARRDHRRDLPVS
ncbi:hypothetical protein DL93DRAFT_2163078 [Clavulina sp. PMI_390]|nr:hypothetical protein DL93DRAFT_2163078 [Clavulina sp. PMI_390]